MEVSARCELRLNARQWIASRRKIESKLRQCQVSFFSKRDFTVARLTPCFAYLLFSLPDFEFDTANLTRFNLNVNTLQMLLQKWKSIVIPNRISGSNHPRLRCQIVKLEINYWFMAVLSEVSIWIVELDYEYSRSACVWSPCFSNLSLLIFEFVTFVEFFSCCFIIIRIRRNWSCVRRYRFWGYAWYQRFFEHVPPFWCMFSFFSNSCYKIDHLILLISF